MVLGGIGGVDVAIRSEVDAAEEKVLAWASLSRAVLMRTSADLEHHAACTSFVVADGLVANLGEPSWVLRPLGCLESH